MWLPWQHHVGSTRSVQPLFRLFLSAYWITPPNNVFKAVFCFVLLFNVCSMSPWLVLLWIGFWKAAVFHIIVFSVCLVCFRCHLPGRSRVTGGCASRQLSSVSVVCEVNVMVTVIRRKQSDDRNVKKHVFVWLVYVCLPVCTALWATYVRVWDAGQLLLVSECLFIIKRGLNFTQDVNRF